MFVDRIDFLQSEIEITSGCYKAVTDRSYLEDEVTTYYRPQSLKMKNYSGGQIDFCFFTTKERTLYLSGGAVVSDLFYLDDAEELAINSPRRHIDWIFVKGATGDSFSSGCSCEIIQE